MRASKDARTGLERAREWPQQAEDEHASSGLPIGGGAKLGDNDIGPYGAGCRNITANLRQVNWPTKFCPNLPEKYDGTIDP
jgi:hypothetical protein